MADLMTVAVVGLGRVGSALGVLLARAGYRVRVCDRKPEAHECILQTAGEQATAISYCTAPEMAAEGAGLVLLTVQDRFIAPLAMKLATLSHRDWTGVHIAHLSGSLTAMQGLAPLAEKGAVIFSLHPLQSLADMEGALAALPGSWFTFEGDERAEPVARELVNALAGRLVSLRADDKPLYHAAAVVASNFFIVLEDFAISLMSGIGVDRETARKMLLPLIRGSFNNLERQAPETALTGPIVRGDDATVAAHLEIITRRFPQYLSAYRLLASLNVDLARRLGAVCENDFPSLTRASRGGEER